LGRKRAGLLEGWFWIAPFLGGALLLVFTPIHPFSISTRYLMVPGIGWAWLLGHWLNALRPSVRKAALATLLVASTVAVLVHSQKYRNETDFWKSALASCPNDSFFLNKYAGQLRENGDFISSEILLRRALSFKMKNSTAVAIALQLSDIAFGGARYEESLGWLEKMRSLKLDPPYARQRLHRLLKIHLARGDLAGAEAVLREAARTSPGLQDPKSRIELYMALAAWDKAREAALALSTPLAAEWLKMVQKEESAFRSLGPGQQARFFISRGNFGSAWNLWPAKDAPGIPEQIKTARLAILAGHEEEGKLRIEQLVKKHEANSRILNTAGNLLFDLQRIDEALDYYQRSLRMNPDQPALIERVKRIGLLQRRPIVP